MSSYEKFATTGIHKNLKIQRTLNTPDYYSAIEVYRPERFSFNGSVISAVGFIVLGFVVGLMF